MSASAPNKNEKWLLALQHCALSSYISSVTYSIFCYLTPPYVGSDGGGNGSGSGCRRKKS